MNNFKLDPSRYSVLTEHMRELNHSFDWNSVLALDVEHHYQKRLISEIFYIKSQSQGINLKKNTELLDNAYAGIIDELACLPSHH